MLQNVGLLRRSGTFRILRGPEEFKRNTKISHALPSDKRTFESAKDHESTNS